jgi:hypothetical protein
MDYMLWSGYQPLVDASFFALALIRSPWLWENLIEYGIREFSQHWYVGDGMFLDGMHITLDYYNSFAVKRYF